MYFLLWVKPTVPPLTGTGAVFVAAPLKFSSTLRQLVIYVVNKIRVNAEPP